MHRATPDRHPDQKMSFRELAEITSPSAVSHLLAAQGWELERERPGIRQVWRLTEEHGRLCGRLMVPLDSDYADYVERLSDALFGLSQLNGWETNELREQLLHARSLTQPHGDQSGGDRAPHLADDSRCRKTHCTCTAGTSTVDAISSIATYEGENPR